MNTQSLRRLPVGLAMLLACGLLAACGSSSKSPSTASGSATSASSGSSTTSGGGTSRTALRNCLKAHGITLPTRRPGTTPPAGGGGGFFGGGGGAGGGFAANPKFRAAIQACGGFRGFGNGRRFRFSSGTLTAFVTCIRTHGFPAMPSPKTSGGPIFPSSIRTNPKFVTALRSCQSLLRPTGAPSGSGAASGSSS